MGLTFRYELELKVGGIHELQNHWVGLQYHSSRRRKQLSHSQGPCIPVLRGKQTVLCGHWMMSATKKLVQHLSTLQSTLEHGTRYYPALKPMKNTGCHAQKPCFLLGKPRFFDGPCQTRKVVCTHILGRLAGLVAQN